MREPGTLGDHLRNRRLDLGLAQREVAELVGATVDTIRNWEAKRTSPQLRFMPRAIAFLGYGPCHNKTDALGQRLVAWPRRRA